MPIKIPVVKAIDNLPASSIVFNRTDGTLSGAFQCAPFGRRIPALVLSSISPRLTLDSRRLAQILRVHDPGIRVRQQSRFIEHELRHRRQIFQGALEPLLSQKPFGLGEYRLRLIAQAEQRLFASGAAPGFGHRKNFLRCHV